jgi:hypothetical protein
MAWVHRKLTTFQYIDGTAVDVFDSLSFICTFKMTNDAENGDNIYLTYYLNVLT